MLSTLRELFSAPSPATLLGAVRSSYVKVPAHDTCTDLLTNQPVELDMQLLHECREMAKWHYLAYASPWDWTVLYDKLHMPNEHFSAFCERLGGSHILQSWKTSNTIRRGSQLSVELPASTRISGFYIRTPLLLFDQQGLPLKQVPSDKTQLANLLCVGNMVCQVMREHLASGKHIIRLLFRGTTDDFTGIPQYGIQYSNTQAFKVPRFHMESMSYFENGSPDKPLFFHQYVELVLQALPHIQKCFEWLDIDGAEKLIVCGCSMGGAFTYIFCYLCKLRFPQWWHKLQGRALATPLCSNVVAVQQFEQWLLESKESNKYIELCNADDIVHLKHALGGVKGMEMSIQQGQIHLISWLLQHSDLAHVPDKSLVYRMIRIVQMYPEAVASLFANGAISNGQVWLVPEQQHVNTRLTFHTRSSKLNYKQVIRMVFCKRAIPAIEEEWLGKSHSHYFDINGIPLWGMNRVYEDVLYDFYLRKGLDSCNELCIVGLFPRHDLPTVHILLNKYLETARPQAKAYQPFQLKLLPQLFPEVSLSSSQSQSLDSQEQLLP